MKHQDLDKFTYAYCECALWSTHDYNEEDSEGIEMLDANYGIEDISNECLAQMAADCADFRANNEDLEAAYARNDEHFYYGPAQAGYDFWLTREGHGAGFWDRGLGEVGERLSALARPYGSFGLYSYEGEVRH